MREGEGERLALWYCHEKAGWNTMRSNTIQHGTTQNVKSERTNESVRHAACLSALPSVSAPATPRLARKTLTTEINSIKQTYDLK